VAQATVTKRIVRHYPIGWTWKQEKLKHYLNGSVRPYWMPQVWFAIAACEQPYGNNSTKWDANSSSFEGAFGFAHSTWDGYKPTTYPNSASEASTWQQYRVALILHSHFRFSPWGCYVNGGYLKHLPN
jgi:hypothetical protein